jgi:hypothetical protein
MSIEPGDVPPDRSPPWRITRVGRQAEWGGGRSRCAACGRPIDLDRPHYYATMSMDAGRSRVRAKEDEAVFCTRTCLDRWSASTTGD